MEPSARVQVTTGRGSPDTSAYFYRVMFGYLLSTFRVTEERRGSAGLHPDLGLAGVGEGGRGDHLQHHLLQHEDRDAQPCPRISSLAIQEIYNKSSYLSTPPCFKLFAGFSEGSSCVVAPCPGSDIGFYIPARPRSQVPAAHHPIIANTNF